LITLSDYIEDYLKKLLAVAPGQYVEIQRSELAEKFQCVPSQINYVLSTRFTPERGYLVQSRRGGRGYIKVMRIDPLYQKIWEELQKQLYSAAEKEYGCEMVKLRDFLMRLYEERLISRREAEIIGSVMREDIFNGLKIGSKEKNELIKRLVSNMLKAVLQEGSM